MKQWTSKRYFFGGLLLTGLVAAIPGCSRNFDESDAEGTIKRELNRQFQFFIENPHISAIKVVPEEGEECIEGFRSLDPDQEPPCQKIWGRRFPESSPFWSLPDDPEQFYVEILPVDVALNTPGWDEFYPAEYGADYTARWRCCGDHDIASGFGEVHISLLGSYAILEGHTSEGDRLLLP